MKSGVQGGYICAYIAGFLGVVIWYTKSSLVLCMKTLILSNWWYFLLQCWCPFCVIFLVFFFSILQDPFCADCCSTQFLIWEFVVRAFVGCLTIFCVFILEQHRMFLGIFCIFAMQGP